MKSKAALQMSIGLILLCTASACSLPEFLGGTRTIPDGAKVDFDNRRTPELNPNGKPASFNIPTPSQTSTNFSRKVPVENIAAENANTVFQQTPVVPVTTAPISNPNYPTLATVPQIPSHQSQQTITKSFSSLNADMTTAKANGTNLMNDNSATVMTSPKTGQLVDNPTKAVAPLAANNVVPPAPITVVMPAATNSNSTPKDNKESGFNHWLHNLFGGDDSVAKKQDSQISEPNKIAVKSTSNVEPTPIIESKNLPFVAPNYTTNTAANNTEDKPIILHKPTISPEESEIVVESQQTTAKSTLDTPSSEPKKTLNTIAPEIASSNAKIDDAASKPELTPAKAVEELKESLKKNEVAKTTDDLPFIAPQTSQATMPKSTLDIPSSEPKKLVNSIAPEIANSNAKLEDANKHELAPAKAVEESKASLEKNEIAKIKTNQEAKQAGDDLTAITTPYEQPVTLVQPKTETGYLGDSRYAPPSKNNGGN